VELCLFDDSDRETRIELTQRRALNWHCYLPDVRPGQRYGYRVSGRYAPLEGHRFNPAKLLIDPYAKAIDGVVDWAHDANVLPYVPTGDEDADLEIDDEDDAAAMPKSVVIDDAFFWEGDRPPRIPVAASRCGSSRAWSRRFTAPASRSSSTSSTTTRPRAITSGRCCRSRAWTTPPTTGSSPTIRGTTWTSPVPATRSTRSSQACSV